VDLSIDEETIKAVLNEYRIHNAEVVIREDITIDQIIDAALGNRVYIPALVVLNKIDLVREDYLDEVKKKTEDFIPISAENGLNLERLKDTVFKRLDFIRIYMKPQGREADLEEPLVVLKGSRVKEVCNHLHKDFEKKFRFARVWGSSAKFEGQKVGINHSLEDRDVLSIITEK
ncbi:MAG: TGS domain-containing protein, partial [Candidatus Hydrothermarchaeales archaeon]